MVIQSISEGAYFHIYTRGVNSSDIFKERRNYYYFLQQYKYYCNDVFETYAYALLKNHFHLLVYVKENVHVARYNDEGTIRLNASKQLSHFLNAYAQAVNKSWHRTGALFESPFKRKLLEKDSDVSDVIYYCHYNPQLHGFVKDFTAYQFSSYHGILENDQSFLATKKVLDWFGGPAAFEKAHTGRYEGKLMAKFTME